MASQRAYPLILANSPFTCPNAVRSTFTTVLEIEKAAWFRNYPFTTVLLHMEIACKTIAVHIKLLIILSFVDVVHSADILSGHKR